MSENMPPRLGAAFVCQRDRPPSGPRNVREWLFWDLRPALLQRSAVHSTMRDGGGWSGAKRRASPGQLGCKGSLFARAHSQGCALIGCPPPAARQIALVHIGMAVSKRYSWPTQEGGERVSCVENRRTPLYTLRKTVIFETSTRNRCRWKLSSLIRSWTGLRRTQPTRLGFRLQLCPNFVSECSKSGRLKMSAICGIRSRSISRNCRAIDRISTPFD
jgi:hypothetical protein